jgi:hypothetical protein
MNPSVLGALAAGLLAILWIARRRPPPLLVDSDGSAIAALNRAQIVRAREVAEAPAAGAGGADPAPDWLPPTPSLHADARERRRFLASLACLFAGDGPSRHQAMVAARRWGDAATLPLLRRGLRDPDPRVMGEAARAMEAFRGRPRQPAPPDPRRVARIR